MDGLSMCMLSKEEFLDRTPGCVGDILYEHLQLLQHDAEEQRSESEYSANNNVNVSIKQNGSNVRQSLSPQQQQHQQQQQHGDVLYDELQLLQEVQASKPTVVTKVEPQQMDFVDRYDDPRLNYSPPMSSYDAFGHANAIYAAMAAFRPNYPPPAMQPNQPFSMYTDHYMVPQHSSYNSAFFHNQVSHKPGFGKVVGFRPRIKYFPINMPVII